MPATAALFFVLRHQGYADLLLGSVLPTVQPVQGIGALRVKVRSAWEVWSGRALYIVFALLALLVVVHVAVRIGYKSLEPFDFLYPILSKF